MAGELRPGPDRDRRRGVFGALFLLGGLSQYSGYSVAISGFDTLGPVSAAWFRSLFTGVMLLAILRPWHGTRSHRALPGRRFLLASLGFGLLIWLLNLANFVAMAEIDLGLATGLEYLGPIALAIALARDSRNILLAIVCAIGVALMVMPSSADLVLSGVVAAVISGALWAAYIVVAGLFGSVRQALVALGTGLVLVAPVMTALELLAGWVLADDGWRVELSWAVIGRGLLIALLASVIPYAVDVYCVGRVGPRLFSLLLGALPILAIAVGHLFLAQQLTVAQMAGVVLMGLVLVGVRRGARASPSLTV